MGLLIIILFVVAGGGLILAGTVGAQGHMVRAGLSLNEDREKIKGLNLRVLLSGIFPFTRQLLERLKLDTKIKSRLDIVHVNLGAAEYFNIKMLLALALGIATIFIFGKFEPLNFVIGLFFGFMLPELWLNKKIGQRKFEIVKVMPETVDLLGLCVEAGLDFTSAVKWVIDKIPHNPLMEELAFVLKEIEWGKARTQALKDMSRRLNIPEISSFVQTLVQAERMGTPVSEAFSILSEDSRAQRFHRGERIALKAPIKILIPLIFCILPVIGIVIGGPIMLQFMQGKLF